jgi:adenylate kinase
MRVTLMGIQASGKGTVARTLAADFGVSHVEIGAFCRRRSMVDDEVGRSIRASMEAGELASEPVIVQALAEELSGVALTGFVLDGFPRTGNQVDTLDTMLTTLGVSLDAPIYLELDEQTARRRLVDRLVCRGCGSATSAQIANDGGPCPKNGCDGTLMWRSDDRNPLTVDKRLKEFFQLTLPVVEHYKQAGRLITIDADRPAEDVYADVLARLTRPMGAESLN